jgi:hypothetical protein
MQECRAKKLQPITVEFAIKIKPSGIHPTEGIPMMFSDQLNVAAEYVKEIQSEHCDLLPNPAPNYNTEVPVNPTHIANSPTDEDILYDTMLSDKPPNVCQLFDPNSTAIDEDQNISADTLHMPIPPRAKSGQKYKPKEARNSPDYAEWKASQF